MFVSVSEDPADENAFGRMGAHDESALTAFVLAPAAFSLLFCSSDRLVSFNRSARIVLYCCVVATTTTNAHASRASLFKADPDPDKYPDNGAKICDTNPDGSLGGPPLGAKFRGVSSLRCVNALTQFFRIKSVILCCTMGTSRRMALRL
jgi:hypothetical protein